MSSLPEPVESVRQLRAPGISEAARIARERLHEEIERVRSGVEEMLDEQEPEQGGDAGADVRRELAEFRIETERLVKSRVGESERRIERSVEEVDARAAALERRIEQIDRVASEGRTAEGPRLQALKALRKRDAELDLKIGAVDKATRTLEVRIEEIGKVSAGRKQSRPPAAKKLRKLKKQTSELSKRLSALENEVRELAGDRARAGDLEQEVEEFRVFDLRTKKLERRIAQVQTDREKAEANLYGNIENVLDMMLAQMRSARGAVEAE